MTAARVTRTGGTAYLDPVVLAASDVLVTVALERAAARVLPRSARTGPRHRAHEQHPVHMNQLDKALAHAWDHLPDLASQWLDVVDVPQWRELLDSYTRALLMMGQPHSATRLAPHLHALALDWPAARDYVAV